MKENNTMDLKGGNEKGMDSSKEPSSDTVVGS
jgi:hypothetical protein